MQYAWTAEQIRAAEAAIIGDHDDGRLMRRAAAGLASVLLRELAPASGSTVHLLVGPGNNGGDALFAGAMLRRRNVRVRAHLVTGRAHEAGLAALLAAGGTVVDLAGLRQRADLVVDGIFGIGGRAGSLPEELVEAIGTTPVVAVDVPSGQDADAVVPTGLRADLTVTFGGLKPAHVLVPEQCGPVDLIDIGLDLAATGEPALSCWELADVAAAWPVPGAQDHKYSRGVVGVDTGSATYPGAARLGVAGALYTGAGMVRYLGTADVVSHFPSAVAAPGRCQAYVVGSGWADRDDAATRLAERVAAAPCVIDADALHPDLLAGLDLSQSLLTPHAGELARLLGRDRGDVESDPVGSTRAVAQRFGTTVLLKGARQFVASGDRVQVAVPGPAWTARAGSGDVLAGACGALLAAGCSPGHAAILAASVQARCAGERPGPWPPEHLVQWFPQTIADLLQPSTMPADAGADTTTRFHSLRGRLD